MGNVTSNLIETAIQSANNDSDSSAHDSLTSDSSKLELYRLLREKMADTDDNQKSEMSGTDGNSSSDAASMAPVPAKEHVMMAPKKKFLIDYRGDEDEITCEKTGAGNFGTDVVAKVSPTSSSTSADVARSRSHTVSLPFRTRGPPQTQAEVPRRPLMESKPADAVSSAVTARSGVMASTDSRLSSPCNNPAPIPQSDASVPTLKPHRVAVEPAVPPLQLASVSHDIRPVQGGYLSVDHYHTALQQQQQRVTPGVVGTVSSSYSPRGNQHYHRESTGVMDAGASARHMTQMVRDRPVMLPVDPGGRHAALQVSEPHVVGVKYDNPMTPMTNHPVMERQLDRRFLPPGGTDRPPPQMADRHFVVPSEYWKEPAVDERRKVGRPMQDHHDMRTAVGHDSYMSQVPVPAPRVVEPHNTVSERAVAASHYMPTDSRSLPPDHAAGSYPSRSADFARVWAGPHPSTDSYRHSSGVVELPARESRTGRPHYDMGDMSQHMRKYPVNETQVSTVEYSGPVAAADVQYNRHHQREPMILPATGSTEAEHLCRRPVPPPAPLQPVEPSVRPRIAGLTHGDPAVYETPLPQFDSSRYSAEHAYRSSKYDVIERPRPSSDVLTPFAASEPKQARRPSPYYSLPGATRSSSGTSGMLGTGPSSGLIRGDSAPRVTLESPLDLTVRKEQSMTAEAFLRRCHDSSQRSSQYLSPGRHATELQYSSYPQHHWTMTGNDGFESSLDVRQRMTAVAGTVPTESLYPRHVGQRVGDAIRPMHSATREYPPQLEPDMRRPQHASYPHHRRTEDEDAPLLYPRRDTDPRWDSSRQPVSSMTSPVVKPTYWDGRYAARPMQTNTEMSESVPDNRGQCNTTSYAGDVNWMGERSQYGARLVKLTDTEPAALNVDRRVHACAELPLALSPQNVPTTAANRRIPMVQLLGGKYSPNDILHLCCKVCGSTYGSLRSFRMHFAKAHGQEPTPENFTIQTISDARIQAMSQRIPEIPLGEESPPTLHIEPSETATAGVGRDVTMTVDTDHHKRNPGGICEFPTTGLVKPRSVAEVQPMQKPSQMVVVDQGPPTPVNKPSPDEATKRSGEDRRMKCKKCGQFSTQDLSILRQHVRSHGSDTSPTHWPTSVCSCECTDAVDSDTGCAVCLEGFNDVSDWQHHVTSQHMMRSCICKSCDLGFTNASALRRHLTTSHGIDSPTGSSVKVEYRCLFCPEAFMDEHSLYAHTRAHEQQYSTQRPHHVSRSFTQMCVQTAVPDTTCPEDQRASATDVTSVDSSAASCTLETDTGGKKAELEMAWKNMDMTGQGDMMAQKSTATYDVRLNSKKASILRRLSADTADHITSSAMTSTSSVGTSSVMKSTLSVASDNEVAVCRQQPPVLFGDLLSSMHHEVESTLRQFATSETAMPMKSATPTLLTSVTPLTSPTPLTSAATLSSSSPCVRDVCDAIIVHALRQREVSQTDVQQRPVDTEGLEPATCMSDSESCMTESKSYYSPSQYSQPHTDPQPQLGRPIECTKPSSDSESTRMSDPRSCTVDTQSHLTDPGQSRLTDLGSQVTIVRMSRSDLDLTGAEEHESRMSDYQSRSTESESVLVESNDGQTLPDVVGAGNTAATSTTNTDPASDNVDGEGDVKKTEAVISGPVADDVDIEDHPLCIDLNRDPSPDGDTVSHL